MNNITTTINLDFAKDASQEYVFAKQGDQETRFVEVIPFDNGQAYTLTAGITARVGATKPDGTTVLDDCTITDGHMFVELTAQILAVPGIMVTEVQLYQGTALLSSQIFYVKIKESAYDVNAPESSDEFNSLVEALAEAEAFSENIPRDYLNITVAVADWSAESPATYPDYPYKADITIADATSDDIPELVPSIAVADEGLLAPLAYATEGSLRIYASEIPANDYTFLRITLRKENVQV